MSIRSINTPCTGLCSTVYGDLVCRGCKRFHHEVVGWNAQNSSEQQHIRQRLDRLLVQAMQSRFQVVDLTLLQQQLVRRDMVFDAKRSPYCSAYLLLVKGARFIQRLEAYGLVVQPEHQGKELWVLLAEVDRMFFQDSEAYYQQHCAGLMAV